MLFLFFTEKLDTLEHVEIIGSFEKLLVTDVASVPEISINCRNTDASEYVTMTSLEMIRRIKIREEVFSISVL